jgi:hypothetical protein
LFPARPVAAGVGEGPEPPPLTQPATSMDAHAIRITGIANILLTIRLISC